MQNVTNIRKQRGNPQQVLYKNGHNWPTYMLRHSGNEPSTLRRSACVFRHHSFNKDMSHAHSSFPLPYLLVFGQLHLT